MSEKERARNVDREKYLKKQKKKRKKKELKKAQAISRNKRNEVRNSVKDYNTFKNICNKSILFIIGDTANMESILLQKHDIGKNRILLTLPVVNQEMLDNFLNDNPSTETSETSLTSASDQILKDIIYYYYSISADNIYDYPEGNMLVIKDFKLSRYNKNNLISVNVRPYNLNTWYKNEFSTIDASRIYNGKKLKTFFNLGRDPSNIYVIQDTILKILLYKAIMRKINMEGLLSDIEVLARRGSFAGKLYQLMATDKNELHRRFQNEGKENRELNEQRKLKKR